MTPEFQTEIKERKLPETIAKLLWQRDIRTPEQLRRFLDPQLTDFHDPFLMADMDKVVTRIQQAVKRRKNLGLWGL